MFRVTSTDMQSTATSMFSAYASFAAFMMMFRSLANDLVPEPVRSYLHSFLRYLFGPLSSTTTVVIVDEWGISRNDVYDAVDTYLRTKISPTTERFKVRKSPKQKSINLCFEKNQEINDTFDGGEVHLRWKFVSIEPKDDDYKEKSFFELSFNKKFKEKVLEEYLPYIMTKAREIEESDKVVKLYSGEGGGWGSINLDHSSSFETLAMESVRDIIPHREFTQARSMVTLEEVGLAKKAATGEAMVARDNPAVAPIARGYGGSPTTGKNQQRGSKGGGSDRGKNNSKRSNKSGSGRGGALVTLEEAGLAKRPATGAAMVTRDNPVAVAPIARGYGGSPAIGKNQQRGSKGGGSDRGKKNSKRSNKSGSGRGGALVTLEEAGLAKKAATGAAMVARDNPVAVAPTARGYGGSPAIGKNQQRGSKGGGSGSGRGGAHMTGGAPANPWQPPYGSAGQSPFGSAGQPQWNNGWAWVRRDGPRPLPEGNCFY